MKKHHKYIIDFFQLPLNIAQTENL